VRCFINKGYIGTQFGVIHGRLKSVNFYLFYLSFASQVISLSVLWFGSLLYPYHRTYEPDHEHQNKGQFQLHQRIYEEKLFTSVKNKFLHKMNLTTKQVK
jgi:hypothetical protein